MTALARPVVAVALATALLTLWTGTAQAQVLGTFNFQLQPYCNVISITIAQEGATYRLSGWDDACGAVQRYPMSGTIAPNNDGTLAFGFVVTRSNGIDVHTNFTFTPVPPFSGPWRDSAGNSGTFVFNGTGGVGARPGPSPNLLPNSVTTNTIQDGAVTAAKIQDGSIGLADVNPAQVQLRVSGSCAVGLAVRAINQDGTVVCGAAVAPTTLFDEASGILNGLTTTCEDLAAINFGTVTAGMLSCSGSVLANFNHVGGTDSILQFSVASTPAPAACGAGLIGTFEMPAAVGNVTGQDVSVPVNRSLLVPAGPLVVYLSGRIVGGLPAANELGHSISCTFTPQ